MLFTFLCSVISIDWSVFGCRLNITLKWVYLACEDAAILTVYCRWQCWVMPRESQSKNDRIKANIQVLLINGSLSYCKYVFQHCERNSMTASLINCKSWVANNSATAWTSVWICMINTDSRKDSVQNYSSELYNEWSIHKELCLISSHSFLSTIVHEIKTSSFCWKAYLSVNKL